MRLMPVEGHDPAIGRHRNGDSPQLSYRRQAGNYLETAFEELGQFGNGKSARLETRSWILAHFPVPMVKLPTSRPVLGKALSRQTPRPESSLLWLKLRRDVANDVSIPPILRQGDGQMPSSVYRHDPQPEAK